MADERPTAVLAALGANVGIAVAKFVAAVVTGSSAMLAEGIHSVADSGNELLLLVGRRRAARPEDELHPFGHGKELYFWSLVVAMVIFGVGGGLSVYEGVLHVLHAPRTADPTWNYWVLAIAFVFEGASFAVGYREFLRNKVEGDGFLAAARRSKDPTVYTVVFEDGTALAGIVVAAAGVFGSHRLGAPWLDGAASIVIGPSGIGCHSVVPPLVDALLVMVAS